MVRAALVLLLLASPSLFAVPLPRDRIAANYFPLATGTTWVYHTEGTEDVNDHTVTVTEAIESRGRIRARLLYKFCTHLDEETLLADLTGVSLEKSPKPVLLLKYPLETGTTWDSELQFEDEPAARAEAKGIEDVEVPAGKFRAIHVHLRSKAHGQVLTRSIWYTPGVGIVKSTYRSGEVANTMVLKSFTLGS